MKKKLNYKKMSLAVACMLLLPTVSGFAAETTRVSLDSLGAQGDGASVETSTSADGNLVVFASAAKNLVAGDTNLKSDIFLRNRATGKTTRISVSSKGGQANGDSDEPKISADGAFVTFTSDANNLVLGDINGKSDIFVKNLATGKVSLVSVGTSGTLANDNCSSPTISAHGDIVAFDSFASNLVPGDFNGKRDVFLRNLNNGTTIRVSVDSTGIEGNNRSASPALNANGTVVAFESKATNLIPLGQDTNGESDVFVYNTRTKKTVRASVDSLGKEGAGPSSAPALNANGDVVVFASGAPLAVGDTNLKNDIYMRNLASGKTTRVSVGSSGQQATLPSTSPALSADGQLVAFESLAPLVIDDVNVDRDIYVHNNVTGDTTRVSVDTLGTEARGDSEAPALNADGRYVAFESIAINLVPADTNNVSDIFVRDRLLFQFLLADVQLTATNPPTSVKRGQNASYTLTIKNNGPNDAANVTLTDIITHGNVVTMTPSQGTCVKSLISVCRLNTLKKGASATVKIDITAAVNPLKQQLTVNASPQDNVLTNNAITVSTSVTP